MILVFVDRLLLASDEQQFIVDDMEVWSKMATWICESQEQYGDDAHRVWSTSISLPTRERYLPSNTTDSRRVRLIQGTKLRSSSYY